MVTPAGIEPAAPELGILFIPKLLLFQIYHLLFPTQLSRLLCFLPPEKPFVPFETQASQNHYRNLS